MAMASPTPMGSSHFASLRRPASRQNFKQPISRPQLTRGDPLSAERKTHARTYSLNDSSDDEIPLPMMKFSALTNALLNDPAPSVDTSLPQTARTTPEPDSEGFQFKAGGSGVVADKKLSPPGSRIHSPYPRRIVRLSGTPSTLRRTSSLSAVQKRGDQPVEKPESPLDLSTPAQAPRTVRLPISSSGNHGLSFGSSGRQSHRTDSGSRNDAAPESHEYPTTVARSHLATSQGSVSRYQPSTIGRTKYGEESSMRVKRVGKVAGTFLSGPARRGRRRMDDEDQSPVDERDNALDSAPSSQEPQSQDSHAPESQDQDALSSQEQEPIMGSHNAPGYRDYASGSPISTREALNSILRSNSPPPPTLASSQRPNSVQSNAVSQPAQPIFKMPAPRPDLPSTHDQENEAPPTFKRNKQPLIHLDKMEKVPVRPESMDLDILRAATPSERRPLALRSQNTPRRPAPPPPKMSILDAATSTAGAATASHASGKRNRLKVNGKPFTRLDCIGRGGSSRVYRVMAENSKFFALKRVSLEDADEAAVIGFKGEIDLLKKLEGVERVIRLYDYELNEEKSTLTVLMEMGELDMNKMLELRLKSENAKLDTSFVRHYWKEMLECLQAIHEHDIVHSDLKPHNFVLVQGRLKLIDFGIANAIQTDETVNVHRENQIGTPNYMSPESLMDSNAKPDARGRIPNEPKLMKLGKPSDIWSLGCILYQMTYGRAPFGHILNPMHRCQAIINFNYEIEYPTLGVGSVPVPSALIKTLKRCLNRNQFERPSATELLDEKDTFLNPIDYDEALPISEELLGRILLNVAAKCKNQTPTETELLTLWPKAYFDRLRKNMAEGKPL
ncbi:Dual-specificity kinase, spindle pole body (SPB) duplication and spindle checkpoint function [Cadophora gregata]|uniref:Dual-specificity kinase, spindle pole body (SPB) duplication and spindle checkpoint function n=1 Tax=Cadophora gregata TaxID=51156 RepID=UPI0026DD4F9B|nr:Dual-specificity kinase, spindle pole body (SPB) duplication and spindle checkpoint function [Cadophora gregata]KAK0103368.1 Dual-specificity kinase, spindle pole body (SPB) duplication and spindle checkpoint function [Cadophora gregata]KAK0107559.1 Dual-specificity kinase, spindle pole body (SPB) duplication and spindle checkpoint function [Cadophora gregata f. sp. sojae]